MKTKKERYIEKIDSLDELEKRGWYMIDDEVILENRLEEIINEKGLLVAELARITGISRQNINAVVKNKMKPGVDFALKVSYVLNVPIEDIFKLKSWYKPLRQELDDTLFVDVVNLEIINNAVKKERIAENGYEYYNVDTKTFHTKKERDSLLREYVKKNTEAKREEVRKRMKGQKLTVNQINSMANEELKEEFNEIYIKIYRKLGEPVTPYIVDIRAGDN